MVIYADVVMALNFAVDLLLLCAANRLSGYPMGVARAALAAAVGSFYAGISLLSGHRIFCDRWLHLISLGVMAAIAFGVGKSALRRCAVFVFLSVTLGGVVYLMQTDSFWGIVATSVFVAVAFSGVYRGQAGGYVPVELHYAGKHLSITALRDTGNALTDPVTGQSVLILDGKTARYLTGLSREQLQDPVGSMGLIPGLRLIPYKTVGNPGGLLLGLKIPDVKVANTVGSRLVAFAPDKLSANGEYEALTGGVL